MPRLMYDSVNPGNLPPRGDLYAAYIDGRYANLAAVKARFPNTPVVTITVLGSDANVADVESGDLTPASSVQWVLRQRAKGQDPTVYCPASLWPQVRAAFQNAHIPEPHYWIAQYDNKPNLMAGAVAKQYGGDMPGNYDISIVADFWPGVDQGDIDLTPQQAQQLDEIHSWLQTLVQGAPSFGVDAAGVDITKDHALLQKIAAHLGVS